jgi:hypothetical protein
MLLHFLFSLKCLIPLQVRTWPPFFVDKIIEKHYSVCCLFVVRAIHPYGEYLICCFLFTHDGAIKTNFERITDFGLWQGLFVKSPILANYSWWGRLVWIVTNPFDHSQSFPNARHG